MMRFEVEKKLDLVLEKLELIEKLLVLRGEPPSEDELEAIKLYLKQKQSGKVRLVSWKVARNNL
ncbi:MAG: hypothetical protein ACTSVM_04400 [Candidatus Ranarchaeia archaeon]